ncbi:hypothetical protein [Roseovarius sp. 2305UL8-3]|uniref:hypothetical protein n=1 Tax=Roseovarius conchicola TaxID=3121636 RepID=UPI003528DEE0
MSAPGPDTLGNAAQAARLAALDTVGRLVRLDQVMGGQVLHTGFGFGPEFWLLPEGTAPNEIETDGVQVTRPTAAKLICDGANPLSDPDPLRLRGVTITMRIPQF